MKYDFDLENQKEARKKLAIKALVTLLEVCAVVALGYGITHWGMQIYTVSGQDMTPTLENGDRILVNKMSYRIHSIKRNDVVIVRQSGSEHNYYSADRVIGLPGETVQIKEGRVYIDGERLKEKYRFPVMENGGVALEEITLDEDEYFVLCDNRNGGEDSRNANVGNVLRDNIVGKAWFRMNTLEIISFLDGFSQEKKDSPSSSPAATGDGK
ncbi:MAG: signal peptidase I [Lachnospiraceae bacterium]|nr:signal peptidase I [Lachnospiraceae bacterium]